MVNTFILAAVCLASCGVAAGSPTIIFDASYAGFGRHEALTLAPGGVDNVYGPFAWRNSEVEAWYVSRLLDNETGNDYRYLLGLANDGECIDALMYFAPDGENSYEWIGAEGPWAYHGSVAEGEIRIDSPRFVAFHMPEPSMLAGGLLFIRRRREDPRYFTPYMAR